MPFRPLEGVSFSEAVKKIRSERLVPFGAELRNPGSSLLDDPRLLRRRLSRGGQFLGLGECRR